MLSEMAGPRASYVVPCQRVALSLPHIADVPDALAAGGGPSSRSRKVASRIRDIIIIEVLEYGEKRKSVNYVVPP